MESNPGPFCTFSVREGFITRIPDFKQIPPPILGTDNYKGIMKRKFPGYQDVMKKVLINSWKRCFCKTNSECFSNIFGSQIPLSLRNVITRALNNEICLFCLTNLKNIKYTPSWLPEGFVCSKKCEDAMDKNFFYENAIFPHKIRIKWMRHLNTLAISKVGLTPSCKEHSSYHTCLMDSINIVGFTNILKDPSNSTKCRKRMI